MTQRAISATEIARLIDAKAFDACRWNAAPSGCGHVRSGANAPSTARRKSLTSSPEVAEAIQVALAHARWTRPTAQNRFAKSVALNREMVRIGRPVLSSPTADDLEIKLAALAAEWMLLPKGKP